MSFAAQARDADRVPSGGVAAARAASEAVLR